MLYNEVKQFINDNSLKNAINSSLETAKRLVDKWNNKNNDLSKISELVEQIIMLEISKYENYQVLWWEDSDDVNSNNMTFIKRVKAITMKYSKDIIKAIENFKYLLDENNWKLENIIGSSHKLSRNEGYSNFKNSSLDEQNNWSNVIVRTDKSDVGDFITLFQFHSEEVIEKLINDIVNNTLVLIY